MMCVNKQKGLESPTKYIKLELTVATTVVTEAAKTAATPHINI